MQAQFEQHKQFFMYTHQTWRQSKAFHIKFKAFVAFVQTQRPKTHVQETLSTE